MSENDSDCDHAVECLHKAKSTHNEADRRTRLTLAALVGVYVGVCGFVSSLFKDRRDTCEHGVDLRAESDDRSDDGHGYATRDQGVFDGSCALVIS